MGWRDRDYNRSGYGGASPAHPLLNLFIGSVPFGTWFGIRVRIHASLLWVIGLTLLFGFTQSLPLGQRAISMGALFAIILLHEFGHCFAARWVGGTADDILMWPLGGLAYASPPHRPWPTFVTVAGGPMVNVVICVICGAWLYFATGGVVPLNPFNPLPPLEFWRLTSVTLWVWWVFEMSYILLLFNLLPIFPLDGGQLLQSILWPKLGYFKSMQFAATTGLIGAAVLIAYGLVMRQFLLIVVAINGGLVCYQKRMLLKETGPEHFTDDEDYSSSFAPEAPRRRASKRAMRRTQRLREQERAEQAKVDAILEKVSNHGMHSLTWWEKRTLRKATERQRKRDEELARMR